MTPRWQEADEAVESLVATLVAAAARTADHGGRKGPRGRARSERRPQSTRRHIADVVRAHKLAPGVRVDRNVIAALFIGHRDHVSNPVLVVAVAQACSILAGRKLSAKKAARMRAASQRVAELIALADADTLLAVPAPRSPVEPAAASVEPAASSVEPAASSVEPAASPSVEPAVVADRRRSRARRRHQARQRLQARRRRRRRARLWWCSAAAALVMVVVAALLLSG
ncbi:hypothetical protein OHA72_42215 [Dactylosporangium sp. NBC_01737]|uniref:hypothetical protein n=1 Tax=Dactylosporangium sp. NBC_01737 TaxID=2975959 RepID=UPI002E12C037|nr:hypothetical protein OHA72_42215 [Dactylosporangium sp. NBC_01737]